MVFIPWSIVRWKLVRCDWLVFFIESMKSYTKTSVILTNEAAALILSHVDASLVSYI